MASIFSRSCSWASLALPASRAATLLVGGAALLLGACASTPPQVVSVARADLACDRVEVVEISEGRFAASGCEKGAVYTRLCRAELGCQWVRLRGVGEPPPTAGGVAPMPATTAAPPREIIPAPPPAPREIIPAPPPAEQKPREIIPAPPPANTQEGTSAPLQQTPLSEGTLSDPYPTELPATPVVQRAEYPPPVPLYETRPLPPAPSYVWVGGYWWWTDARWLWAPGYWCPPRMGFSYVPGGWYWSAGYWWYGPGGWARPGSTIIVHHVEPRPVRVQAVRAFTPHRVVGTPPGQTRFSSGALGVRGADRAPPPAPQVAPAPRAFTPQGSPLNRYPTTLSNPTRLPPVSPSAPAFGRSTAPARSSFGAPPRAPSSSSGFGHVDSSRARMTPGPPPSSFRANPAPLRAAPPPRAPVVAPRGTSFRSQPPPRR